MLEQCAAENKAINHSSVGNEKNRISGRKSNNDNFPFDIPDDWQWVLLKDICDDFRYGTSEKCESLRKEDYIPVLRMGNLQEGQLDTKDLKYLGQNRIKDSLYLRNGDILFNRTNSIEHVGKSAVFKLDGSWSYAGYLIRVRVKAGINPEYVSWFINSQFGRKYIEKVATNTGKAQSNVNAEKLKKFPIPLPSEKIQDLIVSRAESIFGKLKSIQSKMLLISNAKNSASYLKKYRESLLAKAFRGELVPQDPNDEPASELLKRIRSERAKLEKGKKKKQTFAPITEEEKPFDIPDGWEWVRLGELGVWKGGGTPSKSNRDYWRNGSILWVSPKDMGEKEIRDSKDKITKLAMDETNVTVIPCKSLLIVMRSGILQRKVPISLTATPCTINQDLKAFIVDSNKIDSRYLYYCLKAFEKSILENCTKKGATVESLVFEKLYSLPIPLCSTKQQTKLISFIEKSEEKISSTAEMLKNTDGICLTLKSAILQQAFTGKLVPQIPSEGTGHDLLKELQ